MTLGNEINVTKAGICNLLVSPTAASYFVGDGTDFILAMSSNF